MLKGLNKASPKHYKAVNVDLQNPVVTIISSKTQLLTENRLVLTMSATI